MAQFVWAPEEGVLNVLASPRWHGEPDGRAVVLIKVKQMVCQVVHIVLCIV